MIPIELHEATAHGSMEGYYNLNEAIEAMTGYTLSSRIGIDHLSSFCSRTPRI